MNPWVIVGGLIAIAIAAGGGYYKGDQAGRMAVQSEWDQERAAQAEQHAKAQAEAREKEQQLQSAADQLREDKDREIRNLNARAAALANSLRDRKERPAANPGAMPGAAEAGSGAAVCTGAGLSKQDAEFLAGEAARADELRAALRQCLAQYEALRSK